MNYSDHYDKLIDRARGRVLDGYLERHHVLPKCMGGGNSDGNIVDLTPEEHYVAHQLLVKLHPGVRGLVTAAVRMAKQCSGNKAYGWLRRRNVEAARNWRPTDAHREAIGNFWRGRKRSAESIAKAHANRTTYGLTSEKAKAMRAAQPAPFTGRKHSEETRTAISEAQANKKRGPYKPRTAPMSPEGRANIAAGLRGRKRQPFSEEWRAKLSESLRGNRNWRGAA